MKNKRLPGVLALVLVVLTALALDQVTKIHAQNDLLVPLVAGAESKGVHDYSSKSVELFEIGSIRGTGQGFYFGLTYVRNQGSAWGALGNWDDKYRIPFFYVITLVAIFILLGFLRTTPWGHRSARLAFVLILAGALGNCLDRVQYGFVIDWLDAKWQILGWYYDFPIFNLADSYITVGLGILLFDMFVLEGKREKIIAARQPLP